MVADKITQQNIKIRVEPERTFQLQFIHNGTKTGETRKEILSCTERYISPEGDEEDEDSMEMNFNASCNVTNKLCKEEGEENDSILLMFKYTKTNAATAVEDEYNFRIKLEFTLHELSSHNKLPNKSRKLV